MASLSSLENAEKKKVTKQSALLVKKCDDLNGLLATCEQSKLTLKRNTKQDFEKIHKQREEEVKAVNNKYDELESQLMHSVKKVVDEITSFQEDIVKPQRCRVERANELLLKVVGTRKKQTGVVSLGKDVEASLQKIVSAELPELHLSRLLELRSLETCHRKTELVLVDANGVPVGSAKNLESTQPGYKGDHDDAELTKDYSPKRLRPCYQPTEHTHASLVNTDPKSFSKPKPTHFRKPDATDIQGNLCYENTASKFVTKTLAKPPTNLNFITKNEPQLPTELAIDSVSKCVAKYVTKPETKYGTKCETKYVTKAEGSYPTALQSPTAEDVPPEPVKMQPPAYSEINLVSFSNSMSKYHIPGFSSHVAFAGKSIFVVDSFVPVVYKISEKTEPMRHIGIDSTLTIVGLAASPNQLYIQFMDVSEYDRVVHIYSTDGELIRKWDTPNALGASLAVVNGDVVIASRSKLSVCTDTGELVREIVLSPRCVRKLSSLFCDSVIVSGCSTNQVMRVNVATGKTCWVNSEIKAPAATACDKFGRVYVLVKPADIYVLDGETGEMLTHSTLSCAAGVMEDLWVTDDQILITTTSYRESGYDADCYSIVNTFQIESVC